MFCSEFSFIIFQGLMIPDKLSGKKRNRYKKVIYRNESPIKKNEGISINKSCF